MLYTSSRFRSKTPTKITGSATRLTPTLGMTLIEFMLTLSIASIITSIGLPSFNDFIIKLRVDNEISQLGRLLYTARNHAINNEDTVIVCPLGNNGSCSTNWHEELSVFIDRNNNNRLDTANNEFLITTKGPIKTGDRLIYGRNRSQVTYQATGHLFGLGNGTFRYCPMDNEDKSRGIVVARSGRFYATSDNNLDGIDETRSNEVITCE